MRAIEINGTKIGNNEACVVISEIGAMYEDLKGMKQLIMESRDAGADIVKLQTYRAENLALPGAEFELEDGSRMSQFDFFKKHEISREDHKVLFDYAGELGVTIFSTPSYYDDVDFLDELGMPAFKTGSDDLTNYPFLEYIARKGKPMIVSTGMATMTEVEEAVKTILDAGNDQLILLHCTVSYPPGPEYANLNIIHTLQTSFELPVGYSDHVPGIFPSVLAAGLGASVIEKHVTLDRRLKRPDHQVSIEPSELREIVDLIRLIPVLRGSPVKKVYPPEEKWRLNARKSIVAVRDIKKDETIKKEDMKIMRPGDGIHPRHLKSLVGKTLNKNVYQDQPIPEDAI